MMKRLIKLMGRTKKQSKVKKRLWKKNRRKWKKRSWMQKKENQQKMRGSGGHQWKDEEKKDTTELT